MPKAKINLFSKKGLQKMFPNAEVKRTKSGWDIWYPLPKDCMRLRTQDGYKRELEYQG